MRGYHLLTGVLGVVGFLITGQFMRHHQPPLSTLSEATRLMFRSRHIYILSSGLINLILGVYIQKQRAGWREITQLIGSGLVMSSTAILTLAFILEPSRGFQPEMRLSALGLYALFAGCMSHVVASFDKRR